jgi:hypothetical protein
MQKSAVEAVLTGAQHPLGKTPSLVPAARGSGRVVLLT